MARGRLIVGGINGKPGICFTWGRSPSNPADAEAVRLRFAVESGKAKSLTVQDAGLLVTAVNMAG